MLTTFHKLKSRLILTNGQFTFGIFLTTHSSRANGAVCDYMWQPPQMTRTKVHENQMPRKLLQDKSMEKEAEADQAFDVGVAEDTRSFIPRRTNYQNKMVAT